MSTPNPSLSKAYGTQKTARLASAVASGLLTNQLMGMDREHIARLIAEAERMNQMMRVLEERKMRATNAGLTSPSGGIVPDLARYDEDLPLFDSPLFKGGSQDYIKAAEDSARRMARLGVEGMDKEAIGAFIGKLLGKAAPKLLGAASKAGGAPGKLLGQAGAGLGRAGGRLGGVAKTTAMPAVAKTTASAAKTPAAAGAAGGGKGFWGKIMGGRVGGANTPKNISSPVKAPSTSLAATKPVSPGSPGDSLITKTAPRSSAVAKGPAAPSGTSKGFLSQLMGGSKPPPTGWQKFKGTITPGWRTKATLGGAALLGMGGLYAGGKTVKDYMMIPSGLGGWQGAGGYGVRHNVGTYGGGYVG